VTEQSEHLSNAQVENYGKRASDAGAESVQRDDFQRIADRDLNDRDLNDRRLNDHSDDQSISDERVEAHLSDCPSCRSRLLDFHRARFALLAGPDVTVEGVTEKSVPSGSKTSASSSADFTLGDARHPADPRLRTAPTPECPPDDDLRQLAAGLSPDAIATKLTQHAATCDHCGPLLRTFTEDFSDDFAPEEQAALANLKSSSPAWQTNTARQMLEAAGGPATKTSADAADTSAADKESSQQKSFKGSTTTTSGRKPFFWKWALVPATAAVVALAVFSIWYIRRDTPEKVEALLAQAYTEQRTIEMRIPVAKYSEFHQRRSGEPSSSSQLPESFHKAAETISSQLKAHPDDPEWLLLSARLDLMNWQFKQALETLERIENRDPARQSEIDSVRAMALYEKAAYDANQPEGYGDAIQFLKKVLEKNPNDPVALHNQAVACEKAHLYDCAIEDWNRLLTIEKDPGWAGEAQRHLGQIQEKKSPVLTPSPK